MDKRELVRRHYADVLMGLCATHQLRDLTVSNVVTAAGTARQTFYNYFSDLNDLICYAAFLPMALSSDPFTDEESTRKTYEATLRHKAFFTQMPHHTGQNNFWEALQTWLKRTYYDRYLLPTLSRQTYEYRKVCIDLYCVGSAAVFKDWCATNMETPIDAIVAMLYDMSPVFVKDDLTRMPSHVADYPR